MNSANSSRLRGGICKAATPTTGNGNIGPRAVGQTQDSFKPERIQSPVRHGMTPMPTRNGYRPKPDIDTDCQAPRNGSMPRTPAAKPCNRGIQPDRSEEHTSELQSPCNL